MVSEAINRNIICSTVCLVCASFSNEAKQQAYTDAPLSITNYTQIVY